MSVGVFDDAYAGGEAEAGAGGAFGGEEGLEDSFFFFVGNAGSCIADGEDGVVACCGGAAVGDEVLVEVGGVDFEGEDSAVWHGVAGVYGEVEDDLLDLCGVCVGGFFGGAV